jgi:hypothetical protein
VGDALLADIGFVCRIIKNDRLMFPGVCHPFGQLIAG